MATKGQRQPRIGRLEWHGQANCWMAPDAYANLLYQNGLHKSQQGVSLLAAANDERRFAG
jgi:hypothetical protein